MHLKNINAKLKNLKGAFALMALLPFTSSAQDCIKPFNANCWFNQVSYVRISNDGSRIMAWGGNGPSVSSNATTCGSTNVAIKTYRLTDTGMVYFAGQSTGATGFSDFTGKNGMYYMTDIGGGSPNRNIYYRSSSPTVSTAALGS